MTKTKILLALALLAISSTVVAAQPPHFAGVRGPHLERLTRLLDLTAQQVEELELLHEGRESMFGADHDAIRTLFEQVDELVGADRPDAAAIGKLVIEIHQRRDAAEAAREEPHAEMSAILTPEQQERFELLQEMRPERGLRGPRRHHAKGRPGRLPRPGLD